MTKTVTTIGEKIKAYPTIFGMSVALIVFLGIIAIEEWFPSVGDAWDKHDGLVRSIWCTAGFFGAWVNYYWPWRRRRFFWRFLCTFLVAHVTGTLYYATQVHPLDLKDWIILLAIECFIFICCMEWLIRRCNRANGLIGENPSDRPR
jgi:hypothetical protein